MTDFNKEQAIKDYTELSRLISVGAYQERDIDGSYGEDGIEESVDTLASLAAQNGLEFVWHEDTQTYTLEPMREEDRAAFKLVKSMYVTSRLREESEETLTLVERRERLENNMHEAIELASHLSHLAQQIKIDVQQILIDQTESED